jgi:predicted dehydrogenase
MKAKGGIRHKERRAMKVLKAGVVGAGVFGGYHARKYSEIEGVQLVAIFDPDLARAEALAAQYGAEPHEDLREFLDGVDIVTIATPAVTHYDLAREAVAAGKSVYVEKPVTATLEEAERLILAADKAGVVLACGHQERVSFAAMGLLGLPEKPIELSAVRLGPPSERSRDVSCVLDLMIHDLDLALQLTGAEPIAVEAEGAFDHVKAEVTFSNGLTASFEASRIAAGRSRTMRAVFPSGAVDIDFVAPSFSNTTPFALNPDFANTPTGKDPLGVSVARFVAAVRGEGRPVATGLDGAKALDLALAVEKAAEL